MQLNTWTLVDQTLIGHPDLGLQGSGLVETNSSLILMGGTDGLNFYDNVFAYDEDFGFYDTGFKLSSPKADFSVVPL